MKLETAARNEWRRWLERQGLADGLAPEGVAEFTGRIETTRAVLESVRRMRQRLIAAHCFRLAPQRRYIDTVLYLTALGRPRCIGFTAPLCLPGLVTGIRIEELQPVLCSGHPSCRYASAHTPLCSNAVPDDRVTPAPEFLTESINGEASRDRRSQSRKDPDVSPGGTSRVRRSRLASALCSL